MKRFRIVFSADADADAEEAYLFIAAHSPANALRWFDRLQADVLALEFAPERCPLAPEAERAARAIRHLIIGNYRVLFVVAADVVDILHVRHAARKPIPPEPRPPRA